MEKTKLKDIEGLERFSNLGEMLKSWKTGIIWLYILVGIISLILIWKVF